MQTATLEHINLTVTDPKRSAAMLEKLFGWHIRWEGAAMEGGYTVHIGTDDRYLALYSPIESQIVDIKPHKFRGGMSHIAVTVDDLAALETKLAEAGYEVCSRGNYKECESLYFRDHDDIEYEVVSYRA
ncbi:VOC family protein [Litorimonas sp. RW-G-Af-16]|uniref:VOC family protein n=1 Tax=Litorimonas sp. RW-G-Af-16 TaxID=3241168 RepID=UPI00390CBAE4